MAVAVARKGQWWCQLSGTRAWGQPGDSASGVPTKEAGGDSGTKQDARKQWQCRGCRVGALGEWESGELGI
ncbi:hypothetical protein E2562_028179 [Oryza meyeriana var. granulata]|uniref:Uncharacterized protein n=1 Tax=Oryza meyeriana var. granulata TaxID=110450 RepID=A0A6G1CU65_9ORYZ|nr:hypothetical protein E2562_028179 [Oryza meyeriana var. granulata]